VTTRFYALSWASPRIISEIFNTSLDDQKAKGVGSHMLRIIRKSVHPDSGQNDGKIQRHFPIKSAAVAVWGCPNIRHKAVGMATIHSVFGRFFDQIKVVLNRRFFYTF